MENDTMAKLSEEPITAEDLSEYIKSYSDFAFEIKVCNVLKAEGYQCQHSGTYTDPVAQRIREFDIYVLPNYSETVPLNCL